MLFFVDDVAIVATGKNLAETHNKLQNVMTRTDGVLYWVATHNCEFSVKKFQLLNFTRKTILHPFIIKNHDKP